MTVTVERLRRGIRRRLARFFASQPAAENPAPSAYYAQQPTCQIRSLSHLLGKFLGERDTGYYVEVGAHDGLFVSNTWGLAQRGWHGLLIEPVPHLADACRRNYAHLERIEVLQSAVGFSNQEIILHLAGPLMTANTTLWKEYADVAWAKDSATGKQISVPCRTLDNILSNHHVPEHFDLLVVDVEGFEAEVFAGFNLRAWKPKMLIVELTETHPDITATANSDAQLGRMLSQNGYVIVYKDSINTVFVDDDVWESTYGAKK